MHPFGAVAEKRSSVRGGPLVQGEDFEGRHDGARREQVEANGG